MERILISEVGDKCFVSGEYSDVVKIGNMRLGEK